MRREPQWEERPWWYRLLFDRLTGDLKPLVGVIILAVALTINTWIKGPVSWW